VLFDKVMTQQCSDVAVYVQPGWGLLFFLILSLPQATTGTKIPADFFDLRMLIVNVETEFLTWSGVVFYTFA